MTDHDHKQVVPGCYRCDLGKDEERESMLAELLAARARIKSLEGCLVRNMEAAIRRIPKAGAARCDPVMVALAQSSQERDAARADLREALELLRELGRPDHGDDLDARYVAFLEKHKEAEQ